MNFKLITSLREIKDGKLITDYLPVFLDFKTKPKTLIMKIKKGERITGLNIIS